MCKRTMKIPCNTMFYCNYIPNILIEKRGIRCEIAISPPPPPGTGLTPGTRTAGWKSLAPATINQLLLLESLARNYCT